MPPQRAVEHGPFNQSALQMNLVIISAGVLHDAIVGRL